jgi:hypothetical protein
MAFKLKGSPMQRNFGISPMKDEVHKTKVVRNDEGQVIKRIHYDVHGNVISIVRHQEEGKPIPETTKKQ